MNTGGRSGRRVALTETRKAGTAKINANTVQAKAEKTMEAAMPTIAGHITPKMVHPQHRVVYDGTLAGLNSVEAHLANEKAQRKAVTELIKRKQFNKVPAHLQAGYRARSRAALTNSYTQTVGHKWNARVVKALAEDLPLESKSRGKVFKEAVDARKEYQQSAQMYSTAYKRYRTVREEFSGDSSSESEKDIFDDVLLPKKKGSE